MTSLVSMRKYTQRQTLIDSRPHRILKKINREHQSPNMQSLQDEIENGAPIQVVYAKIKQLVCSTMPNNTSTLQVNQNLKDAFDWTPYIKGKMNKYKTEYDLVKGRILQNGEQITPDEAEDIADAVKYSKKNDKTYLFYIRTSPSSFHVDPLLIKGGKVYMLQTRSVVTETVMECLEKQLQKFKISKGDILTLPEIYTTDRNGDMQKAHYQGDAYSCGMIGTKIVKKLVENNFELFKEVFHDGNNLFLPPSTFAYNQSTRFKEAYAQQYKKMHTNTSLSTTDDTTPSVNSDTASHTGNIMPSSTLIRGESIPYMGVLTEEDIPIDKYSTFLRHFKHFARTRERVG